jgi:hypothetical protein
MRITLAKMCNLRRVSFLMQLSKDDEPLYNALETWGYNDIYQLLTMSYDDINALTYPDASGNDIPLPFYSKVQIRILKAYHLHRDEQGDPIGDAWTSITTEEFNEFHVGPVYNLMTMSMKPVSSCSTP